MNDPLAVTARDLIKDAEQRAEAEAAMAMAWKHRAEASERELNSVLADLNLPNCGASDDALHDTAARICKHLLSRVRTIDEWDDDPTYGNSLEGVTRWLWYRLRQVRDASSEEIAGRLIGDSG